MKEGYIYATLMGITVFGIALALIRTNERKEVTTAEPIYICSYKQIIVIEGITPPFEKVEIPEPVNREFLIDVLIEAESEGKNFIGDQGRAFGCLQIHKCALIDVNRHFETDYEHLQVLHNTTISRDVCRKYWQIYASEDASYEELARLWNGGPGWRNNPKTIRYWEKVKRIIESRKRKKLAALYLRR